jgi:hypothetical protein
VHAESSTCAAFRDADLDGTDTAEQIRRTEGGH